MIQGFCVRENIDYVLITPVKCSEIKTFLTSILCDEVDDMLLTSLRQSDILQGCHLHMVSWYLAQKLWSLLNHAFVFGLCWNYDCVLSPLELLFWIWCLLDKW